MAGFAAALSKPIGQSPAPRLPDEMPFAACRRVVRMSVHGHRLQNVLAVVVR